MSGADVLELRAAPRDTPGSFVYRGAGVPDVRVYAVVPSTLNPATRVVLIMHGRSRNADDYVDGWASWAARNDYIAVAPRFDDDDWPEARGYNFGNVFTGDDGSGARNPEEGWSFTVVEGIHRQVVSAFGLADRRYDLWGHSAGGQFVHRFVLFKPRAPLRLAIAANAGVYMLPDLGIDFPFGARHPLLSFTRLDLLDYTNKPVIVMRGALDTERTENLPQTPDADAQGPNRFERAGHIYDRVKALNPASPWRLIDVPDAGHEQRKMAPAAQPLLQAGGVGALAADAAGSEA